MAGSIVHYIFDHACALTSRLLYSWKMRWLLVVVNVATAALWIPGSGRLLSELSRSLSSVP